MVGVTGSQEKCDHLVNNLGFDAAINYRKNNVKVSAILYYYFNTSPFDTFELMYFVQIQFRDMLNPI